MAVKISFSRSCPAELVRNLKRTAAKPTPQPVTVAYSAVEAPTSSLLTGTRRNPWLRLRLRLRSWDPDWSRVASAVWLMTSPDGWPGPEVRVDGLMCSRFLDRVRGRDQVFASGGE